MKSELSWLKFWQLDVHGRTLYFEAFLQLFRARILLLFPFALVARLLGEVMRESDGSVPGHRLREILVIGEAVRIAGRHTFWNSKCLVQAVAAKKMLERRKLNSTLYLGIRRENGRMLAHAWLRCGPYIITGAEGKEKFTIVGKFANTVTADAEGDQDE